MSKSNNRTAYRCDDGQWANKFKGAREMSRSKSGGEVTTMERDGKIVSKDTIAPAHDPFPPRDREH